MEQLFNFSLNTSKPISKNCIDIGLTDFISVCKHVQQLPYGRNKNRANFTTILHEKKGTCSTKHAFLKQIALENKNIPETNKIQLCLGIYKMNETNTKGIGKILSKHQLDYIPEAHTYLKYKNKIFDFTRTTASKTSFYDSILLEEKILPKQIGNYKIETHKNFLKNWLLNENIPFTFSEIWKIRETCIAALSK